MGKFSEEARRQGQKDGSKPNRYKEPYGIVRAAIDSNARKANAAYNQGHKASSKERKKNS